MPVTDEDDPNDQDAALSKALLLDTLGDGGGGDDDDDDQSSLSWVDGFGGGGGDEMEGGDMEGDDMEGDDDGGGGGRGGGGGGAGGGGGGDDGDDDADRNGRDHAHQFDEAIFRREFQDTPATAKMRSHVNRMGFDLVDVAGRGDCLLLAFFKALSLLPEPHIDDTNVDDLLARKGRCRDHDGSPMNHCVVDDSAKCLRALFIWQLRSDLRAGTIQEMERFVDWHAPGRPSVNSHRQSSVEAMLYFMHLNRMDDFAHCKECISDEDAVNMWTTRSPTVVIQVDSDDDALDWLPAGSLLTAESLALTRRLKGLCLTWVCM